MTPSPTPQPIPVEGDVQIFADQECTRYADGSVATVYARVNVPWGIDEGWETGGSLQPASAFIAGAPTAEYPDDPYSMGVWVSWVSADYVLPFEPGQVVALTPYESTVPVASPTVVFSRP